MEGNNVIKIAHTANLPTLNIKSQLNINIDSNTHIKQVLNIETCLIDAQIEPMLNKALVKGTIGVKAIYVDTDNMFNTLSDTASFSETINSDYLTADCQINIINSQFVAEFFNDDKTLHLTIDGSIDCFCNLNTGLNAFNSSSDALITKKSVLSTYCCMQTINKTTNYDYDFKLDAKISKMLSCDSKIIVEEAKCYEGYILLSGQIVNTIIYDVEGDGNNIIKINTNQTPFKCEVEANGCDNECVADVNAHINLNSTQITTDIGENDTKFNIEYCIVVNGYIYKNINIDVIEDAYSLNNSVELVRNGYSLCKKMPYFKVNESVDSEITLADELNIEEILGMVNTSASITQHSIKDNGIIVEGVVNGTLLYWDENREIKQLATQLPYSVNIKQEFTEQVCGLNMSVKPISCKCKIKRGNTLMIDYEMCFAGSAYTQTQVELIDNVKYGKTLDYGDIAFQIYIAHPNESAWDLCKRLHITQEQLIEYNKEAPTTYVGGEKIVVYR